jgi:hypothetical protein
MFSLKEIWKNRKKILEGIKNAVLRDELFVNHVNIMEINVLFLVLNPVVENVVVH